MLGNFIKRLSRRENRFFTLLIIFSSLQFMFFSFSGFSRHFNYLSSINDLGHFDQGIWGFLNGNPFLNTDIFNFKINSLGFHFTPILAFFVPAYLMTPHVGWLIISQSLALSLASWPIFFLAKEIFQSEKVSFIWAIIFSLNAFVLNAAAWDFHPVTLAVPFIALAYLAVEKRNFRLLLFCCFFIFLCMEHFGLTAIGFGVLWGIRYKDIKKPIILIFLGITHVVVVLSVIMPYFSPLGKHLMFSAGQGQLSRYEWLGSSPFEIITRVVKNPLHFLRIIFFDFNGNKYLLSLLVPLLFLPFFGIEFLLPGLADFTANMLSANRLPRHIFSYHSVTLIPVCTVAAIYGLKRFMLVCKKFSHLEISIFALITTLIFGWIFFPFFQLPGSVYLWKAKNFLTFHDPALQEIKNVVKEDFSVVAQANVGAHFTQRQEIYTYPNNIGKADAIVLRLDSPTWRLEDKNPGAVAFLAHHLQMNPQQYLESIRVLLDDKRYGIGLWKDPWLIMLRAETNSKDRASVEKKVRELELSWQ